MLSGAANAWHKVVFKVTFNIIKSQKRLSAYKILEYIKNFFFSKTENVWGGLPSKFFADDRELSDAHFYKIFV